MNKYDLILILRKQNHLTHNQAKAIVNNIFLQMQTTILKEEPIKISGFGQFYTIDTTNKVCYLNQKPYPVKTKKTLHFKPTAKFNKEFRKDKITNDQ